MRRREFIALLGGAAGALICPDVFAAQKSPVARIRYLSVVPPPTECCVTPECRVVRWVCQSTPCGVCSLASDLRAFGWREGENLQIEVRSSQGDPAGLPRVAAELVALRPDILIGIGSNEAKALQAATSEIPIFFQTSSYPVGYGGQHRPPRQKRHRNCGSSTDTVGQTARATRGAAWSSARQSRLVEQS
jgi:hypothetical protein